LKERLQQAEEEKEMSNQALSKYKVSLSTGLNSGPYKNSSIETSHGTLFLQNILETAFIFAPWS
jgi:hypothetical protein